MYRMRVTTIKPPKNKSSAGSFYYSLEFSKGSPHQKVLSTCKTWGDLDRIIAPRDIEFLCLSQKKRRGSEKYLVKIPTAGKILPCIDYWRLLHFDRILVVDTNTNIVGNSLQSVTGFIEMRKDGGEFTISPPGAFRFDPLLKIHVKTPFAQIDKESLSRIAPIAEKVGIIQCYESLQKEADQFLLIVTDCNLGDLHSWNERSSEIMAAAPQLPPNTYFGYASADRRNAHELCSLMHDVNAAAHLSVE